ncbi:MAG: DUF3034 family protein [Burkholderiales bacterium]|nr:DUF3034 family protein [Burkholderiales bacterium]
MKKMLGMSAIAGLLMATGAQAAITNIDGQAGGGLVPWALLSSGPTVAITHIATQNLDINSVAINTSFSNMVEISYAHNMLNDGAATALGVNTDNVDNVGFKVKLNDMSDTMPQFAIGGVYKRASGNLADYLNTALGVNKSSTDLYGAVSKIVNLGGKNVLLNGVLRATKANALGFLGFGGGNVAGASTGYKIEPELSAEVFAADNVIVGAEYRRQPNYGMTGTGQGNVLSQNSTYDINIVYVANKNFTLTAAYVNLGTVAPGVNGQGRQNGMFLQGQVSF